MNTDLLTLDALKRMVEIATNETVDDDLLKRLIRTASDTVTQYTGREFVPTWKTRRYDARGDHYTPTTLTVRHDLLDVTALTNGDGTTFASSDYLLVPYDDYPKREIALKASSSNRFTYDEEWRGAIQVTGVWGYHEQWPDAWIDTLDTVQDAPLTDSATTITVTDADGADARGLTPRFEVLGYYRVENEVVQVTNVTIPVPPAPVVHTLTVRRGMLGTTAAEHAAGTAIRRYLPMQNIELAALSLAAWLYRNRQNVGERYQFLDGTQLVTNLAPSHIKDTLMAYRRLRME